MSKHFNPMARPEQYDSKVSLGQATIIETRETAIRVRLVDTCSRWIPESVIHEDSEVFKGCDGAGDLIVKSWWAESQGLS